MKTHVHTEAYSVGDTLEQRYYMVHSDKRNYCEDTYCTYADCTPAAQAESEREAHRTLTQWGLQQKKEAAA